MKKNTLLVAFLMFLSSAAAFADGAKIKVDGMVCSFCAQGIKKKFSENPAVESCDVDLEKKEVALTFKKEMKMSDDDIRRTIKEAGYNVHKLERVK